jgi:hypothetical protein
MYVINLDQYEEILQRRLDETQLNRQRNPADHILIGMENAYSSALKIFKQLRIGPLEF